MKSANKYLVIKNLEQYNKYCDEHERLTLKEDAKHTDDLELLELLIESYDQQLMKAKSSNLNPVELLRILLKDGAISQKELANSIHVSEQLVSDILNYKRNISQEMARKLSSYFSMSSEAFSRAYDLGLCRTQFKQSKSTASR